MAARAPLVSLGRYEVLKHLASGGMADVLLARTMSDGFERYVVVKRIRAEQANDDRYVAMFLDEARLASSLHHPNVVQVHDIGEANGEYFFTMEYVHSEDARRLLTALSKRDELIPLEHVISIVAAAAAGLHHAHEACGPDRKPLGIVHRDVSPANLLIGYDGCVKVADFGIAKATRRNVETQSGTLKGKVAYMSPEQCVGEGMDRTSDVFSLGIVLYELLTVRRLFKGDNDFLTMTSIVLGHIPPPSKYRPDLPEALEEIILKALENKPADRYQTADEFRLALEKFAADHGLPSTSAGLAAYMRTVFGERQKPWIDDEPELEVSIDFDGSASGVVAPVVDAMLSGKVAVASPGSAGARSDAEASRRSIDAPLRRAHTETAQLASEAVAPVQTGPVLTGPVHLDPAAPELVAERFQLTQSVIMPSSIAKRRSRASWLVGGTAAVVVALTALLLVVSRTSEPAAPRPAANVVRPTVTPSPPPPIVPPNLAATTPEPVASTASVSTPTAAKRPRVGPAKKKLPAKPPANAAPAAKTPPKWSPDSLFPNR